MIVSFDQLRGIWDQLKTPNQRGFIEAQVPLHMWLHLWTYYNVLLIAIYL
jgi:hypothetical protein